MYSSFSRGAPHQLPRVFHIGLQHGRRGVRVESMPPPCGPFARPLSLESDGSTLDRHRALCGNELRLSAAQRKPAV